MLGSGITATGSTTSFTNTSKQPQRFYLIISCNSAELASMISFSRPSLFPHGKCCQACEYEKYASCHLLLKKGSNVNNGSSGRSRCQVIPKRS